MEQLDLVPLWRALAEPKRRRIIELLHVRPHTTGELCTFFDVSRFAIMQHLKVLEGANMIKTRRDGRQRWNSLNEGLFQQIQQAYLDSDDENHGYRFQNVLWFLLGQERTSSQPTMQEVIRIRVTLKASVEVVFQAVTQDIDDWWSRRSSPDSKLYLEAHPGGRLYEAFDTGENGVLYATVVLIRAPWELLLTGLMGLVDDPVPSTFHLRLEAEGNQTSLQLIHRFSGAPRASTIETLKSSWQTLLAQDLRSYVETVDNRREAAVPTPPANRPLLEQNSWQS